MNELHADKRLSESKFVVIDLVNPNHSGVVKELQWTVCILASSCLTTAANRAWCCNSQEAFAPSPLCKHGAPPPHPLQWPRPHLMHRGQIHSFKWEKSRANQEAARCFAEKCDSGTATVAPPSLCSGSHANSGLLVQPFAWRKFMQMHFYLCLSTGVMCVIWQRRGKKKNKTTRKKTSISTHCDAP